VIGGRDSEEDNNDREKEAFEEEYFIRLPTTKAEKRRKKSKSSRFVDELQDLDDFGDVEKVIKSARRQQGSQGGPESAISQALRKIRNVERDVQGEQDYEEMADSVKKRRRKGKSGNYQQDPNAFRKVVQVEGGAGKREITYEMEKNKGRIASRKSLIARVKNRKKYEKAEKARSGMVRKVRKEDNRYGGEATGINVNVVRTTQLK